MAAVLLHAGMPKTGSTSIQFWLRDHADVLAAHGWRTIVDMSGPGGVDYRFTAAGDAPNVTSNVFLLRYAAAMQREAPAGDRTALAEEFVAALETAIAEHGDVVVSSEGFAALIQADERPFLDALDALAARHRVTVAYYLRPQDTALEARWREWGFLSGPDPAEWLAAESRDLRYLEAYRAIADRAPAFEFAPIPFRRDVLAEGSTVVDFTGRFLGITDPPPSSLMNLGLSLDLVNLLHRAPPELLNRPARPDGLGWRQGELGRISRAWNVAESPEAVASRAVLREYALAEFEPANRELAARLGWPVDHLVDGDRDPRWCDTAPGALLAEVERLWTPAAGRNVLDHLFGAIGEIWNHDRSR